MARLPCAWFATYPHVVRADRGVEAARQVGSTLRGTTPRIRSTSAITK